MTHRVVFEIEVDGADNSIEAAKQVEGWLQDKSKRWQYYVQDINTEEISSIDLEEDESDMEVPANDYMPLIKN